MKIRRSLAAGVGLALLAPLAAPGAAGAAPTPDPVVVDAQAWLATQQQADGGFEVAGFTGFETSDAVAALAGAAQTGPAWSTTEARAAVEAIQTGGKDALDAIDDLVDGESDPSSDAAGARAAKVITLVAAPTGIDPRDFDPSNDSPEPVDLVGRMDVHRGEDGSYDLGALYNGVLYAALALDLSGGSVAPAHVAQVTAGKRPDGSWNYLGDQDPENGGDVDTTAVALLALKAAGRTAADPVVAGGLAYLRSGQQANGAWQSFGSDDPNATAMASIALSALHADPVVSTTKDPYAWLATQQLATGRIASPSDGFGINTLPTTQSIEALARQWYLADDRLDLIESWSEDLVSPAVDPQPDVANQLASDSVGPNSSVKRERTAAANALLASIDGRKAAAADIFEAALDRGLDPSGSNYWSNKLVTISRPEMLARITGSTEFYRNAGGTIPTFVDKVYQSVLARPSDPSGRAYWIRRLEGGTSVQQVARSLTASPEYRRGQVTASYQRLVGRAPTAGELNYWTDRILKTRIEVLLQTIAASQEYYDAAGVDEA